MSDQLQMFPESSFEASDSATSLPESVSGPTHSGALAGQKILQPGPVAVRVNPGALPASAPGTQTTATSGQSGGPLSLSDALSLSLASRYQELTAGLGSTLYKLTWKTLVTPAGRSIHQLRASAPRTPANGYTGWRRPICSDANGRRESDGKRGIMNNSLAHYVVRPWNRPAATDHKGGYQGGRMRNGKLSTDRLDVTAQCVDFGKTPSGFFSGIMVDAGGQLNPELSRWLMGLPREWDEFAVTETL